MSLEHILLGLLDEPASGYDLGRTFEGSLRHFWAAELAQIYPTLNRMEKKGRLTSRQAAPDRGPARRLYRRTRAGERALAEWLEAGPEVGTERLTWLAQVFFLDEAGDRDSERAFMTRLRDAMAAKLAALRAIEAQWRSEVPGFPDSLPPRERCRWWTLEVGIRRVGATRDWAQSCLDRLA